MAKCHQMSNDLATFWNFSQLLAFNGATFGNFCHLLEIFHIYWQFLTSFGKFDKNVFTIFENFWHFLATFCIFWQLFFAIFGNFCHVLATLCDFCHILAVIDNFYQIWPFLATLDNFGQILVSFGCSHKLLATFMNIFSL